jgi:hypothetical protein
MIERVAAALAARGELTRDEIELFIRGSGDTPSTCPSLSNV